ncbi:hypothetical protein ACF0H5_023548 [Mactra antiquata]
MKLVGLFVLACIMYTAVAVPCKDKTECTQTCDDGYHEQCLENMCKCPPHECDDTTKCPQGAGSGCPPFCSTKCTDSKCMCNCNNSN